MLIHERDGCRKCDAATTEPCLQANYEWLMIDASHIKVRPHVAGPARHVKTPDAFIAVVYICCITILAAIRAQFM